MQSVDQSEIDKFDSVSDQWWDARGAFAPLHRMNETRVSIISNWAGDMAGKKVLDIACGGGLASEEMAKLGANVVGVDASEKAIAVAKNHAQGGDLDIDYRVGTSGDVKGKFDVVLALEVIEHVPCKRAFIQDAAARVKKGGSLVISSVNRTAMSYALAIVAAEYILRWVPRGTHDWKKFPKPSEVSKIAEEFELNTIDVCGMTFNPISGKFDVQQHDTRVNYIMHLQK